MDYRVPAQVRLGRAVMRPFFRGLLHVLSPVTIVGLQHVPASGAYLIAINHVSLYEAPFVLAFWPVAPEAAGAADIWNRKGQSTLARLYGGIPVRRGEYDRQLLETMLAVLKSGRPLLLAPEGARSHVPGMQRGMPGVAYLVEKTGVPVVPVGITGTTDDYLQRALHGERPRLSMNIGAPLYLPEITGKTDARREMRQKNVDEIMEHIAALLPEEYRGVYAKPAGAAA